MNRVKCIWCRCTHKRQPNEPQCYDELGSTLLCCTCIICGCEPRANIDVASCESCKDKLTQDGSYVGYVTAAQHEGIHNKA